MRPKFDPKSLAGGIVYIKPVDVEDLPREVRDQAGDLRQIFAVHMDNGEQLALVADRSMAFALAREHEMVPYGVH